MHEEKLKRCMKKERNGVLERLEWWIEKKGSGKGKERRNEGIQKE